MERLDRIYSPFDHCRLDTNILNYILADVHFSDNLARLGSVELCPHLKCNSIYKMSIAHLNDLLVKVELSKMWIELPNNFGFQWSTNID